jgi:hypothetical protein
LQVLLARLQFFQFHKACFLFIRYCGELRGEGAAPKTNFFLSYCDKLTLNRSADCFRLFHR